MASAVVGSDKTHILELAVASGSPPIVTHNIRHFLKAKPFGVRVMSPKRFLETLR